jgi:DnaJ-class molecular chaperone
MEDPYKVLGVEKSATADEIRARYRQLAKEHHPDLNPGKASEERFKAISNAYGILSDPEKRARYDRGEIDESGNERPSARQFYRDFGDEPGRSKYRAEVFDEQDLGDIFARAFGARTRAGAGAQNFSFRGSDVHYTLSVEFIEAANGATKRLTLPDGKVLDVHIPAGLRDGQMLRLSGKGEPGYGDGPPGDALIQVHVRPHAQFRREGDDIIVELAVSLSEAVLGAKVETPTIKGPVSLTIPPNSTSGSRLRLRGRGISGGHQFVELKVMVPTEDEPELRAFLESWKPRHPFDPRKAAVRT